ncbi:MAG TPA: dihydrofolate reductase [Flavobacterium sp.]|nr:dihydrofolate reductase [Flavobacterium sp.]
MIVIIAAAANNNALGKDNKMLWHLPDDFKHFKALTTGHHIIMGRKTFESLPGVLPNRTHIIITRQKDFKASGCLTAQSLEHALQMAPKGEDVFVIGGAEIYRLALPIASKIELTRVHTIAQADAWFPELDPEQWECISRAHHDADDRHAHAFTFETYLRKRH